MPAIMRGLVTLGEGVSEEEFRAAFTRFAAHLQEAGFATGRTFSRHRANPRFNKDLPRFTHETSVIFPSLETLEACYAYIFCGGEPVQSVHRRMISKVMPNSARFYEVEEI